jgi:CRP-like cAMP-binding protein
VFEYKPGMYFGERALLNHARRAASIVATSVKKKKKFK